MSTNPPSDPTVAYYDTHATRFAEDTLGLDVGRLYEPFLALIPPRGQILDAGCGAGRDSLAFLRQGYQVTAFDASPNLARLASDITGLPVAVLRFQDLMYDEQFDGIWACASLLHVPRREIEDVFARLTRSLRPGGVWYMSFKAGQGEGVRDGRFFNDYNEERLQGVIAHQPELLLLCTWTMGDFRPSRRGNCWTNALIRRGDSRPTARLSGDSSP